MLFDRECIEKVFIIHIFRKNNWTDIREKYVGNFALHNGYNKIKQIRESFIFFTIFLISLTLEIEGLCPGSKLIDPAALRSKRCSKY